VQWHSRGTEFRPMSFPVHLARAIAGLRVRYRLSQSEVMRARRLSSSSLPRRRINDRSTPRSSRRSLTYETIDSRDINIEALKST